MNLSERGLACSMLVVALASFAWASEARRPNAPRVLRSGEMACLLGGGTYQDTCCTTDPVCLPPTTHLCSQYGDISCERKSDYVNTENNQRGCVGREIGYTCNESGNVVCLETYNCVWQDTQGLCVRGDIGPSPEGYAPQNCDPNCP